MMEMFTTKLFTGDYHFFDYKYDIESYAGQDAGGAAQTLFLIVSLALLVLLLSLGMAFVPCKKNPGKDIYLLT